MMFRKYFRMGDFIESGMYDDSAKWIYEQLTGEQWISGNYDVDIYDLAKLIKFKHSWDAIVYVDFNPVFEAEPTKFDTKVLKEKTEWSFKMQYICSTTKNKYKTLISSYNASKSKIMDKLKHENKSKFNDTPQAGTSLDDDNHTSNITMNEQTVDYEVMDRLAKVDALFINIDRDWVNEFGGLFLEEDVD